MILLILTKRKLCSKFHILLFLLEWFFASPIAWLAKVQISDNFQTLQNADSMSPADLVCYWTAWLEPLLMFQNLSWQIKVTIHLNQDFPVNFFDILPMMYVVKAQEFSSYLSCMLLIIWCMYRNFEYQRGALQLSTLIFIFSYID